MGCGKVTKMKRAMTKFYREKGYGEERIRGIEYGRARKLGMI